VFLPTNRMKSVRFFCFLFAALFCFQLASAQQGDSSRLRVVSVDNVAVKQKADTTVKPKHDPKKATRRSLILPGWGQAYNKKYWKIPIIYAALGVTAGIFRYNLINYNECRYAYNYVITRGTPDSVNYSFDQIHPELQYFAKEGDSYSLQVYRNEFRKNIDYSVLFFILFWGLNVVDATVDGHLMEFDVSNDLTMKLKPTMMSTSNLPGLSVALAIGKHPPKALLPLP